MGNSLFLLGKLVATPAALEVLERAQQSPAVFLERHRSGDWGDCSDADFDSNGDVDQDDFTIFQCCYSGENIAADPDCAD